MYIHTCTQNLRDATNKWKFEYEMKSLKLASKCILLWKKRVNITLVCFTLPFALSLPYCVRVCVNESSVWIIAQFGSLLRTWSPLSGWVQIGCLHCNDHLLMERERVRRCVQSVLANTIMFATAIKQSLSSLLSNQEVRKKIVNNVRNIKKKDGWIERQTRTLTFVPV